MERMKDLEEKLREAIKAVRQWEEELGRLQQEGHALLEEQRRFPGYIREADRQALEANDFAIKSAQTQVNYWTGKVNNIQSDLEAGLGAIAKAQENRLRAAMSQPPTMIPSPAVARQQAGYAESRTPGDPHTQQDVANPQHQGEARSVDPPPSQGEARSTDPSLAQGGPSNIGGSTEDHSRATHDHPPQPTPYPKVTNVVLWVGSRASNIQTAEGCEGFWNSKGYQRVRAVASSRIWGSSDPREAPQGWYLWFTNPVEAATLAGNTSFTSEGGKFSLGLDDSLRLATPDEDEWVNREMAQADSLYALESERLREEGMRMRQENEGLREELRRRDEEARKSQEAQEAESRIFKRELEEMRRQIAHLQAIKTPTPEFAPHPTSARTSGVPPGIGLTPTPYHTLYQTPAVARPQGHLGGGGVPGEGRYTHIRDQMAQQMATPRIHGHRNLQDHTSRRTTREELRPHQAGANDPGARESFPTGSTPLASQAGLTRQATRDWLHETVSHY